MPWSMRQAPRFTKKANTDSKKNQWSAVANSVLDKTGDDAAAIRIANGVVKKRAGSAKTPR